MSSGEAAFAAIEQEKENVRPLRGGRKVLALAEAFRARRAGEADETASSDVASALQSQRTHFEQSLRGRARGAQDPVQIWCSYVQWAAEAFPTSSTEERLLLERATRDLSSDPRYREDERHLQLWLRLVDLHRDPGQVFAFLWASEIGASHAAFYAAWAEHLSASRRIDEAAEVLGIGIARRAAPVEKLREARDRLARRSLGTEARAEGPRVVLNPLTSDEAADLRRPLDARGCQGARLATGGAQFLPLAPLSVFEDLAKPQASILAACSTRRRMPPAERLMQKENQRASEGRISGGRPAPRPATSRGDLEIFVDDEFRGVARSRPTAGAPSEATPTTLGHAGALMGPRQRTAAVEAELPARGRELRRWASDPARAEPQTPPARGREGGSDGPSSAPPVRAPGAPSRRGERRPRAQFEPCAAQALAVSLSSMVLEERPAKRRCGPADGEAGAGRQLAREISTASSPLCRAASEVSLLTPSRPHRSCARQLFAEPSCPDSRSGGSPSTPSSAESSGSLRDLHEGRNCGAASLELGAPLAVPACPRLLVFED